MRAPTRNRLGHETSPYLLQHAANPVDWFPWGPEALDLARREGRPIFLSIGYSACHWCHVMERESFEDARIASFLNEHFVCIKVDREERPDLDEIYMKAVQYMTGSGGWPMSVFLTPELKPFYGGTYFPPYGAYGRPGFADLLRSLQHAWAVNREKVAEQAERLTEQIARESRMDTSGQVDREVLDRSLHTLQQNFDPAWGGFGPAPKFPHASDLRILLRHHLRLGRPEILHMATYTLDRMANGGIYDQLGGGFHRYSTDEMWLIPHFEKMLYDNALLVPAYLEAYLVTGNEEYARVARESCDWALREMSTPEGGFASTQDADSEGEEGRFFVWTPDELRDALGALHGAWAQEWFGVTETGNFEHGASALWREHAPGEVAEKLGVPLQRLEAAMAEAREKLLAARERRVRPGTDDKVLAAWNGLMISALGLAYQVLGEERYLESARKAARYVVHEMRQEDGRLFATARAGRAHINACLDDYAFMIQGLVDLYESDFDFEWLDQARRLNDVLESRFVDEERGGYFTTGDDHEPLIARLRNPQDGALPSGNAVQALNLLRLSELFGREDLARAAERTLLALGALVNRFPAAFGQLLIAVDYLTAGPREVVISGKDAHPEVQKMLRVVRTTFRPQRVVARAKEGAPVGEMPILRDRPAGVEGARAYVCRNHVCRAPVETAEGLGGEIRG